MRRGKELLIATVITILMLLTTTSSVFSQYGREPQIINSGGSIKNQGILPSSKSLEPTAIDTSAAGEQVIRLVNWEGERVNQVAYSPDGKTLAAASSLGIHFYDVQTLKLLRFIPAETWVRTLAYSPNGSFLVAGYYDDTVRLWSTGDGTLVRTLEGPTDQVHSVAFSPDGQFLAAASNDNAIRVWRVADGSLQKTFRQKVEGVRMVVFSPDGTMLASGGSDGVIRLWRLSDGTLVRELIGHSEWVRTVAFSPDGTLLASGAFDHTARLWRVSDGAPMFTLTGHSSSILSVDFSPDGQTLATGDVDKTIGIWRVSDGSLLDILTGNTNFIFSVDFSPSGEQVASGAMDGTLRIWNLSDGHKFSPGVTPSAWVGEPAPQDCQLCHHPGWYSQPAMVIDISCKTCHTQGASLFWDPYFSRDLDPVTGKLSNGTP